MSAFDNPNLDAKLLRYLDSCTINAVTAFGDSLTLYRDITDMNELGWKLVQLIPQQSEHFGYYNILVWERVPASDE